MNEDRAIVIYGGAIQELRRELLNLIGEEMAGAVLFRYGFRCGKLTAKNLGIRPEPHEIMEFLRNMCAEAGIGDLSPLDVKDSYISLKVSRALDDEDGNGGDFTRGYIAGALSEFSGKSFYCRKEGDIYYLSEGDLYQKEDKDGRKGGL